MRITDYADLIRCMPYREQAFEIKKEIWLPENREKGFKYQNDRIEEVFKSMKHQQDSFNKNMGKYVIENDSFMISRNDLFYSSFDLDQFIIKVLMWGYPTKGRGRNIDNFLEPENFSLFMSKLEEVDNNKYISLPDIQELLKKNKGLGFSTLSKILYFKRINVESIPALILDLRVISTLNSSRFKDFGIDQFKNLRYDNAVQNYISYLDFIHTLADHIKTDADRVEMFLFEFGSNLKELTGEEGDWSLLDD
jgi:hypothetical protein